MATQWEYQVMYEADGKHHSVKWTRTTIPIWTDADAEDLRVEIQEAIHRSDVKILSYSPITPLPVYKHP